MVQSKSIFRVVPAKELGLQHFRYRAPQFFPERRLPEYAVVCCFSGCIDVWENSVQTTLLPGQILVGNPGLLRGSQYIPVDGLCEGATGVVGVKLMQSLLQELRLVSADENALMVGKISAPLLVTEIQKAIAVASEPRHGVHSYLDGFLSQFLVEVLWAWPTPAIFPRTMAPTQYLSRRHFVHAVEYMNRCPKHEFTVDSLCEQIGISLAHFRRLLYASAQRSPLDFYNRVLIRRAERMIGDRVSLRQVSDELGFASQSQFGKMFRLMNGSSPSEYQDRSVVIKSKPLLAGSIIVDRN